MTCDVFEEQVSALIDCELQDGEAELLFRHMSGCAACRGSLRTALELRSGLKEMTPPMAPKELDEKVLGAVPGVKRYAASRKPMPILMWRRRISLPLPVALAVSLTLVLGSISMSLLWLGSAKRQPETQVQTVYVTTLPAVEVQGRYPQPKATIQ